MISETTDNNIYLMAVTKGGCDWPMKATIATPWNTTKYEEKNVQVNP